MIKRFNPDFSLSISHELAYMRETPEGGYVAHGDYATLFSELELVKADRDAQQKRADALAVENAELKASLMFWDADSPESPYDSPEEIANDLSLDYNEEFEVQVAARLPNRKYRVCETWECQCQLELVEGAEIETPATSAALAAIRTDSHIAGLEAAANRIGVISLRYRAGQKQELIKAIGRDVLQYANELREAK